MPQPKRKGDRPARSHGDHGRVRVTVYLEDDDFDALETYVKRERERFSNVIGKAIRAYLRGKRVDSGE